MMPNDFGFFERGLALAVEDLQPERINAALARYAKDCLAEVIDRGEASPVFERYVGGRKGAPEESVKVPETIRYEFVYWDLVIREAIQALQNQVPRRTGRYAESFVVTVGGHLVTDYKSIAPDAEVVIFNVQPYTRKMQAGALRTRSGAVVGARHFHLARSAFNRRFGGAFEAEVKFLNIAGGVAPDVPYIIKGEYARRRAARIADPKESERKFPGKKFWRRKDMEAGQPITYPAMIISAL